MRYSTTRQGWRQVDISDEADWSEFERMAEIVCTEFDARIVERLDGLDERYWVLEVSEQSVTLHLQTYLGINVYSSSSEAELQVGRIGQLLESKTR